MLPTKSNTATPGCTPISSECVVWQGPNIPCINLCTGDSISDVTYKMAEKLCAIQGAYDLSALQLNDLATFCTSIAGPPTGTNKTILTVLDYIIKKLGCVNTKVDAIVPGSTYSEPQVALPTCLQYVDPATNQTVTQLVHNQYTLRLGTQYCVLKGVVDGHTTAINNHATRITALELRGSAALPLVTPNCSYPNIPQNVPAAIDLVLDAVEGDLCNLRQAVGSNNQLVAAAGQFSSAVCPGGTNLNTAQALSKATGTTMAGAYASLGWNSTVANLSQSIQNLWITVHDMRCVINDLKQCCGQVDCSKFLLNNYTVSTDLTRQNVTLDFTNMSFPGTGFTNATSVKSMVTITDDVSTITYEIPNFVGLLTNPTLVIPVAGSGVTSPLNPARTYTIRVRAGITKDGTTCDKSSDPKYSYISCSAPQISGVANG